MIAKFRRLDMGNGPGNADKPHPAEPANGNGPVEGGELPQPDPASFVSPETDFGLLTSDAQDSAEVERAFSEAKEALEAQLQFGPEWGPRSAAQENGRYGFGNIVGIGIAEKEVNGQPVGTLAVTVYVIAKVPAYMVAPEALVPESIYDLPTDVVEFGEDHPLALAGKYRPVPAGVSIGPKPWIDATVGYGTAGCLLRRNSQTHVLSCRHVLLNPTGSAVGDPIYQPSLFDGGNSSTDQIATLSYWVVLNSSAWNYVDCAMARVVDNSLVTPRIQCLAVTSGSVPWFTSSWLVCTSMIVRKCGRTTGLTSGGIVSCSHDGWSGAYYFKNQILIKPWTTPFAERGDSGAVVFWKSPSSHKAWPVGLLKSRSTTGYGIASPFGAVLSGLGASMAFGLT
jgi:hypothetical protein